VLLTEPRGAAAIRPGTYALDRDARTGHSRIVQEVQLDAEGGRSLTLQRTRAQDNESVWSYVAKLTIPEGELATEVYDHGDWLRPFFQDLADAWRGFEGTKEYGSLEGQLLLACQHDGRGTVECKVTLRQPWPPEWSVEAVLHFGAGAHLERLADQVGAFVAGGH
jgi:uncharacterized protein DUF6228